MRILIIGAGEVGYNIASRLASENKKVTVIDKDEAAIRRLSENLDVQSIQASATSPKALIEAGIKESEILLAVTDSDEVNLATCLLASHMAPEIKMLARVRNAELDDFHQRFREAAPHIDTIINPETEVVRTIRRLMHIPGAVDVGDFVEGKVSYAGLRISKSSKMVGMSMSAFSTRFGEDHPLIAAILRNTQVIVPRGDTRFHADDLIYIICEKKDLERKLNLFGLGHKPVKTALVIGGGRIGERLARTLVDDGIKTKIIEQDLSRCDELSRQINGALVLHGDGSDQSLLLEENIGQTDVVIPVTDDDETNILISLLAKSMGARDTITKIGKTNYHPLLPAIGIDKVVSPRLSAISSILQDVRKGKVLSDISIFGEQGEFIEAMALDRSSITGKPIKKISFPKGTLLLCVIHEGQVVIPTGETVVEPGNRLLLFAVNHAVKKLETLLSVKFTRGE